MCGKHLGKSHQTEITGEQNIASFLSSSLPGDPGSIPGIVGCVCRA